MTQQTFVVGTAPGGVPGVGHAWQMMRSPVRFMTSLAAHGDLVQIRIGPSTAYVPCHPELLRRVLAGDQVYDKGGVFYDRARDVAGNGLVTCPYRDHRRQRRLMQGAFTRPQLRHYAGAMHAEIEATTRQWRDGQVIDAFPEFYGLALRVVARTLWSTALDAELTRGVERAFDTVLNGLFRQMFLPRPLRRLPTPANRRYRAALRHLHEVTQCLIAGYEGQPDAAAGELDLLGALLAARDEDGGRLTEAEVHDQVITVMAAGTETVAATLVWVFHRLAQHPSVAEELYREIDTVLAGRPAVWEDLPALALTDRVITETLRLHPPGWLFTRLTGTDAELAGVPLPAGSTLVFSPAAVSRDPEAFPRPDEFRPDRWLPEDESPLARQAFTAFGAGARKCLGDLYARTEATLALATMLSHWRLTPEQDTDIRAVPLATVYRPRRLRLRLTSRTAPAVAAPVEEPEHESVEEARGIS
ncbi:pentalenene oxygenase [Kitasatospora gansuensis]|uniref:Pentalenene oxygenase n=1 Tax=Kitasatospora gansuensis TaxID=258050 RepID=A0A7W7SJV8_9ACTN|nr:cytochrome P450 [Kitasatospora gansuensis]MBB4951828.1 pentalenene oxygenase [Kitasatospora gansuensis]